MITNVTDTREPYPLGARAEADGIFFSFVSEDPNCGILLYDARTGRELRKIPFSEEDRVGNIYCRTVESVQPETVVYQFYRGQEIVPDEHGRVFPGRHVFGRKREKGSMRAGLLSGQYDWEGDKCPAIPYCDAVCYCLHVRGFTKHISSGVRNRGTFAGIREKIPYLKELGITTLELQPAYEFLELEEFSEKLPPYCTPEQGKNHGKDRKVNYWGYKKGYYYAPKASYSASEDAPKELKELVKALHESGMELVMQFYFPEDADRNEIAGILHFWALEYHVDGFHLMGEELPVDMLATDHLLADRKIMYYSFDQRKVYDKIKSPGRPHLAEYNDGYLYDMRRFLKGDEGMLSNALRQMRYIPEKAGRVHYLTNYFGFTLADLVSYDYKHNEANGEENRDGSDYNCSWNCGEEGTTRSRKVRQLRTRQIKNAMCMLLLSQSTPLIFMGDEFGNSQKGNNNPWCQDNNVCWLDWGLQDRNIELLNFWKQLIAFRKQHPILRPKSQLRLMDYISCGYPDLSYHGDNAWRPYMDVYSRYAGIMLCGKYVMTDRNRTDDFLYIAVNMHWESHLLALPRLPKGMRWRMAFATEETGGLKESPGEENPDSSVMVAARSIAVLVSVSGEDTGGRSRSKRSRKDAGDRQ